MLVNILQKYKTVVNYTTTGSLLESEQKVLKNIMVDCSRVRASIYRLKKKKMYGDYFKFWSQTRVFPKDLVRCLYLRTHQDFYNQVYRVLRT